MVELMFPLITAVPEPTQQDQYFQSLAAHLGVTQETLRATIGRPSATRRRGRQPEGQSRGATPSPFAKLDRDPLEDYCLALVLQHQEVEEAGIDEELAEHLDALAHKPLPPLATGRRAGALEGAIRRLEERYLRELKNEEEIRFSESPPDWQEETHDSILEVNERLRQNQYKRSSLLQDISTQG